MPSLFPIPVLCIPQLEEGDVKNGTVASMEENISMVTVPAGKVRLCPCCDQNAGVEL
jgi:hypothetical protein